MRFLWVILTVSLLLGCASSPDKMETSYVSSVKYKHYDCDQLVEEHENVSRHERVLYQSLDKEASADTAQMAVGLVIFWPTLFFLEGGDGPQAAEYSRLKGEKVALEKASVQKKCSADQIAALEVIQYTGKRLPMNIKGYNNGERSSLAEDREEAIINAKLLAISNAGYNTSRIVREKDIEKRNEEIEKKANQILVPGYKIKDKGYLKDDTYKVLLIGKTYQVIR